MRSFQCPEQRLGHLRPGALPGAHRLIIDRQGLTDTDRCKPSAAAACGCFQQFPAISCAASPRGKSIV
eukprot:11225361-Alexandrium_andersonii.AAC.1